MLPSTDHIHIIADHDPVRIQYQTETVSDEEFRLFLERQTESLGEGASLKREGADGQAVMISDASLGATMPSTQRRMQADWLKKHEEDLKATCLATYIVIPNALRRGVMTAVLWLVNPPIEVHAVSSLEQAAERAVARAEEAGLEVPITLRSNPGEAVRRSIERATNGSSSTFGASAH